MDTDAFFFGLFFSRAMAASEPFCFLQREFPYLSVPVPHAPAPFCQNESSVLLHFRMRILSILGAPDDSHEKVSLRHALLSSALSLRLPSPSPNVVYRREELCHDWPLRHGPVQRQKRFICVDITQLPSFQPSALIALLVLCKTQVFENKTSPAFGMKPYQQPMRR